MKITAIAPCLLLFGANAFGAGETILHPTTVGILVGHETLTANLPDWRERTLQLQHQFGKRHLIGAELSETDRFGMRDSRLGISYTHPLSEKLTGTIDAGSSPTHHVVAKNSLGAALQYEFIPTWLLHVGNRTTRYESVRVNQATLTVEHYFSAFSWAITWQPVRAYGTTANSGQVRGSYYYGDKNSVTLMWSTGEEATVIGRNVIITPLQASALFGRHWIDSRWALNYGISHTRQGNLYSRSGVNLGVQYSY